MSNKESVGKKEHHFLMTENKELRSLWIENEGDYTSGTIKLRYILAILAVSICAAIIYAWLVTTVSTRPETACEELAWLDDAPQARCRRNG